MNLTNLYEIAERKINALKITPEIEGFICMDVIITINNTTEYVMQVDIDGNMTFKKIISPPGCNLLVDGSRLIDEFDASMSEVENALAAAIQIEFCPNYEG